MQFGGGKLLRNKMFQQTKKVTGDGEGKEMSTEKTSLKLVLCDARGLLIRNLFTALHHRGNFVITVDLFSEN